MGPGGGGRGWGVVNKWGGADPSRIYAAILFLQLILIIEKLPLLCTDFYPSNFLPLNIRSKNSIFD